MYNIRFIPYYVFFITLVYGLFTGISVLLENEFRVPFTRRTYIEGPLATGVGIALVILALWSGWMLYRLITTNPF
jgi:hypothetical protein